MKYVAACDWQNNKLEFLMFGYTEHHYIRQTSGDSNRYTCGMIHIWKSYTSFSKKSYNYHDKRFDPTEEDWEVSEENIFDSFDEAKNYFFKRLFRER